MASSLLSEFSFGSYLVYSPRGTSDTSILSRRYRDAIKGGHEAVIAEIVRHLVTNFASTPLSEILGNDVALVPAPRSGVLVTGGLWPPRMIAEALVSVGLGKQVIPCLKRTTAVPKSAFQGPGERPSATRHYDSMQVDPELIATTRIVVVDDFVTKGSTLLGAASRLAEAFPRAQISAFALVRTKGLQGEIDSLIEPCVGTIRAVGTDSFREP